MKIPRTAPGKGKERDGKDREGKITEMGKKEREEG